VAHVQASDDMQLGSVYCATYGLFEPCGAHGTVQVVSFCRCCMRARWLLPCYADENTPPPSLPRPQGAAAAAVLRFVTALLPAVRIRGFQLPSISRAVLYGALDSARHACGHGSNGRPGPGLLRSWSQLGVMIPHYYHTEAASMPSLLFCALLTAHATAWNHVPVLLFLKKIQGGRVFSPTYLYRQPR
jgi:hypothetical protein